MLVVELEGIPTTSNEDAIVEFRMILGMCLKQESESTFRDTVSVYKESDFNYFDYGFSGSHFWVHDNTTNNRIIIIKFSN